MSIFSVGHCVLVFVCFTTSLFGAGPTLHLWVAERFCQLHGITDEEVLQKIVVGTELPDIRYITRKAREITHPYILNIDEVCQSKTPFELGMKLHAWLDITRENFIAPQVYEAIFPHAEGFSATLLKMIEEEILADHYDGRKWSYYFDHTVSEELDFANEDEILRWHTLIQWTMAVRPSWLLWAQSYAGPAFGVPASVLYKWCYL